MFAFGRLLQSLGLVVLPLAVLLNLTDEQNFTLAKSLTVSTFGLLAFGVGYCLCLLANKSK